MIEIDWHRLKTEPRQHQREGVRWLITDEDPAHGRVIPRVYLLGDEVGGGKSKQVVDAAQLLYEARTIDSVVVVGPAAALPVWKDPRPEVGEIARHGWATVPNAVLEYSAKRPRLPATPTATHLPWLVTNYEFLRRPERLLPVLNWAQNHKFWLVCDEAWALSDCHTQQWKAVNKLRQMASRVTLLNGTPVTDTPLDLYGQMWLLDPRIINIRSGRTGGPVFSHFRARYALLKPNTSFPLITGWQNLEELRAKVAPYVMRRLTRECFDLPEEMPPITLEPRMTDETWRIYRQMRDDMVAWLNQTDGSTAQQAIVKGLRLAQITSGFLGGVHQILQEQDGELDFGTQLRDGERLVDMSSNVVREIGHEKLDAVLTWLAGEYLTGKLPNRILVWSRFRPEIERTARAFDPMSKSPHLSFRPYLLYGEQKPADRQAAIDALNPDLDPGEPVVVVGSRGAGGAALNLAGASVEINLSYSFLLREYTQARGRTDRPGLRHRLQRVDVVATGPKGQKTVDHHVLADLREKKSIAEWTTATWRRKLMEE